MNISDSIISKLNGCDLYKQVEGWVIEYPEFSKLADEQMHTFWPWDEPDVDNDLQDLRVRMTKQEKHAVTENLKLFTLYEMHVGDDYWTGRVMKRFKRPEIQRMASMFSCVEFNSHAPFYNRVNEILYKDTEEFYSEWKQDEVLKDRMSFIGKYASDKNDLVSTAAFSIIEGAILYSSFAFFKHFQSQACGKDLIKNVCRGINLSVADENTHAVGGALLFRKLLEQVKPFLTKSESTYLQDIILEIALKAYEHECLIIDKLFIKGEIEGITSKNMYNFIKHRVNLCVSQLGYPEVFDESDSDKFIESWFYKDINTVAFHDFFSGSGSEYNIKWKKDRFGKVWANKGV